MATRALFLVLALATRGAVGFSVALPRLNLRRPAASGTLGIGDVSTSGATLRICRSSGVTLRVAGDDVTHASAIMAGASFGLLLAWWIDRADESAVVETEQSSTSEQAAMAEMTAVVDSSLAKEQAAAVAFEAKEDAAAVMAKQQAEEEAASAAASQAAEKAAAELVAKNEAATAAAALAADWQNEKGASAAAAKKQAEAEAKMVAEAATAAAKEAEEQAAKSAEKEVKQHTEPGTAASISSVHKCGFGGTAPAAAYYPRDAPPAEAATNLRKVATRPLTTAIASELAPSVHKCGFGGMAPAAAYYPLKGAAAPNTAVIEGAGAVEVRHQCHPAWKRGQFRV